MSETGPITEAEWAEHRRAMLQELPAPLKDRTLPSILLAYQRELLQSTAQETLVVCEKSRRIGMTWGVAADAVLTAAAQKSAGGMDTLYLGYNLDMAREFIDACAMWARSFVPAASAVEEYLFTEDATSGQGAGADRAIQSFRIRFASGFEIVALSSRPRSFRGRQGFAIIDEAAFHDDLDGLLKAAIALLIWGGKVLAISTHNGADSSFAALIEEIRSGRRAGHVVRTSFDQALEQGLYQRICLVTGRAWSAEAEATWRAEIRSYYGDAAAEELDCVPSQGSGVYLTGALIEACMTADAPVLRLTCPDGFALQPDAYRESYVRDWLAEHADPLLDTLDKNLRHSYGFDFGRTGDLSVYLPLAEERRLILRAPFSLELRNVPFRQQEQIVFHITDRLPRFCNGKHDARGNGQYLAEVAQQRYGALRIEAVMLTQGWYLDHAPRYKARFEDRTILLPRDADTKADHRLLRVVRGVPLIPNDVHTKGSDGGQRHGDSCVAGMLAVAAAEADAIEYGYRPASTDRLDGGAGETRGGFMHAGDDDADARRPWWRAPLGSFVRGGM